MANETTSSILIEADPASVMAVIADFDAYPTWAKGVKSAEVLLKREGAAKALRWADERTLVVDQARVPLP